MPGLRYKAYLPFIFSPCIRVRPIEKCRSDRRQGRALHDSIGFRCQHSDSFSPGASGIRFAHHQLRKRKSLPFIVQVLVPPWAGPPDCAVKGFARNIQDYRQHKTGGLQFAVLTMGTSIRPHAESLESRQARAQFITLAHQQKFRDQNGS